MRYEVDYGLQGDHERRVWRTQDEFAYDGQWEPEVTPKKEHTVLQGRG